MSAPLRTGPGASPVRRVLAQVRFDTLAVLRNGEQLLLNIILPALVLVGLVQFEAIPLLGADFVGRVPAAFGGALALAVASSAFTSPAIQLAFDRQWGVLRMLATTPLGPTGLLLGRLGAVVLVLVSQVLVLGAVAALTAAALPGERVVGPDFGIGAALGACAITLLGAAALLGLGVLIGGTLRPQAVLALANTLWALLAAGGGLVVAPAHLPGFLGTLVGWLPTAALGNGLRAALVEGRVDFGALALLAVWAVVLDVVAARAVRWD